MLDIITRLFPVWAILISIVAYCIPQGFEGITHWTASLLMLIMFAMGVTLSSSDFKRVFFQPLPVIAGLVLQYSLMPLIAWLLSRLLHMPQELTIGMILVGCASGGTASNLVTSLARGNVALSITLTALSTLVGVFATPLLLRLYVDAKVTVDMHGILKSIFQIVVFPVGAGLVFNYFFNRKMDSIKRIAPLVSMFAILFLISGLIAVNTKTILSLGPLVVAGVVLHNTIGLIGGYWGAKLFRFDEATCRTLAIEVGMQNSGFAAALGKLYFMPLTALPGTLFSIWHNVSGSLLASFWINHPIRTVPNGGDDPLQSRHNPI
ncbi:MAG: bile acid:sodium symporter [Verrucomicrobia bacterium]|nr:MAG: bile acid:sodium symporter [Verrucomicrobiota bacterium]